MKFGNLTFEPIGENLNLVGEPTQKGVKTNNLEGILVAEIDPELSDTASFCEKYGIGMDVSVNCVIVECRREGRTWYAACLVPATIRADINGIVRRELGASKISFAPMEKATGLSNMAYGAISPIGLPADWPILVHDDAVELEHAVIGSGVRQSKLLVPGSTFGKLPNAKVMSLTK